MTSDYDRSSLDAEHGPSISCLMVTLPVPERLSSAIQSIEDYCRQTWRNKNLIIVVNGGEAPIKQAISDHVAALGRSDIRVIAPAGELNLGQLRNVSLDAAQGELVCQWDDDDRYHPLRLGRQAGELTERDLEAVYLQDVMQYFPAQGAMFWANWRATPTTGHPGTLLARRSVIPNYPTQGGEARLGEDSEVARALIARGRVGTLADAAHLYVYVSHGANSWNEAHHQMLCSELAISRGLLRRREQEIREGLRPYGFAPDTVTVCGSNGEGFRL
jgi:glycosyltransferase involved in cell wall biosynthesis